MTTLLHSPLLGFRITMPAPGWFCADLYLKFDSACFPTATQAALWALANC